MNPSNLIAEKQDLLITPNLQPNQLPTLFEQAASVAPVGETRDMLLIGHKLLMHAAMVFQMMPELKATPVGEIGVICSKSSSSKCFPRTLPSRRQ